MRIIFLNSAVIFFVQTADETYLRTGPGSPGYTRASPRSPGPGTASAGTSGTGSGPGNCSGSRAGKRKSRDASCTPGVPGSSGSSNLASPASNPKNTRCKRPKVVHSNWENPVKQFTPSEWGGRTVRAKYQNRYFILFLLTQLFFPLNLLILHNIHVIRYNLSLRGIIHLKIVDFY